MLERVGWLRVHLVLLVLVAVVPIAGFAVVDGLYRRAGDRYEAAGNVARAADLAAAEIARALEGMRQTLIVATHLSGVQAGGGGECSRQLGRLVGHSSLYVNMIVVAADGRVTCSGVPMRSPVQVADRVWFRRVVSARRFTVGTYTVERIGQRPVVPVAYPIFDAAGRLRGVVAAALSVDYLRDLAAVARIPPGGSILVIDDEGTILTRHPNPELWRGRSVPDEPLVARILAGREVAELDFQGADGVRRLHGVARVGVPEQMGSLFVSVGVPVAMAYEQANQAMARNLAGIAAVALVALLLAVGGGSVLLVRPIARVAAAARRMAAGDLDVRTGVRSHGEVGRLAAAFDDMAEALAARSAELRRARDFLDRLVATVPGMVFRIDPATLRFSYVSPGVRFLTGRTVEELALLGEGWLALIHPDDRTAFREAVGGLLRARAERGELTFRLHHADGGLRWILAPLQIEYDAGGAPAGAVGCAFDITERVQAEERVRAALSDAERANRAKSEFLSRVSHELRTPLGVAMGFAQLLEADSLSEEQRDAVGHIMEASGHLLELIDRVLDVARMETIGQSVSVGAVALGPVLQESLDHIRPMAARHDVALPDGPKGANGVLVVADARRLGQVFRSLLSNAVKFNRPGGRVEVVTSAPADGRVRVEVRDTGFGMAPEVAARLFVPFERGDAEARGIGGMGIRLALSRALVEAMGGRMGVESTPGQGSRFWVELHAAER
ncbi:MAG: ATP-binding protein [Armatimonadota bacterium]|nr:ATP-binding protein [Armatimonadota bacterium]